MPYSSEQKLLAFEYTLKQLLSWQNNLRGPHIVADNDISTLKGVKMLFFVTAAATMPDGENYLLKNVFDKFVAMPFGHVESFIYDQIKSRNGDLNYYTIDSEKTVPRQGCSPDELNNKDKVADEIKSNVDLAISNLQKSNSQLIGLSAFDLVNLSHRWYSWQKNYAIAQQNNKRSEQIPFADIISEHKIYGFQLF